MEPGAPDPDDSRIERRVRVMSNEQMKIKSEPPNPDDSLEKRVEKLEAKVELLQKLVELIDDRVGYQVKR